MARRMTDGDAATAIAQTLLQLAVLLQAGVAPPRAWEHVAATGDRIAQQVHSAAAAGMPLPDAVAEVGGPWREVAAAWSVASTVGAPLADTLRGTATALRDAGEAADEVRVALAEPAGTAALMAWLPLVGVGLGLVLGFDTLRVLVATPVGIACLVAGLLLIIAARRWSAALVGRARPRAGIPGLHAELLAIALSGGVSIDRARQVVADARRAVTGSAPASAVGSAPASAPESAPGTAIETALELSRSAGAPAVELLRAAASLERHRSRVEGRVRAARLSSSLLLPLGVCTLPAFLLLGVAPMLVSVISAVPMPL